MGRDNVTRFLSVVALFQTLALLLACGNSNTQMKFLAVSDSLNHRVLIFNIPFTTGESASVVLGQADFSGDSPNRGAGPTTNSLNTPSALTKDAEGNLYVSDGANCRILQFKPPFTNGMSASLVIGEPDFTTADCQTISNATGIGIDSAGNLWVADTIGNRILEYVPPFKNGMAATLAIGQSNLTTRADCTQIDGTLSAKSVCGPSSITFDREGNLWVSDFARVLQFRPPFSTGMAASLELGEPAATAFTDLYGFMTAPPDTILSVSPRGLSFDSKGNLWVADLPANRILEFVPPFTNGMPASLVIGQDDFTTGEPNQGDPFGPPTASTLNRPNGAAFDTSGNLIVTDTLETRVLIYRPPFKNGMDATIVIGEPDFISGATTQPPRSPAANSLSFPTDLLPF